MKYYLFTFLKGMAMGIAEVVPGVSGGTIAFITGIYEKLINSIKSFDLNLIGVLRKEGIKGAWNHVNGNFLLALFGGMAVSIISLVSLITWLIEQYQVLLWAFFFGLIVSSAIYIGRQVNKWTFIKMLAMIIGIIVAYYITVASPANGNEALWFVFLSGMIAISAMLLPGLSGSFILLLLGMYGYIFGELKALNFTVIAVFAAGCLTGILSFSHLLSWTFKNFKELTLAVLTGFMIGSLNKVWPWRNVLSYRTDSHGEEVPFLEKSVLPNAFTGDDTYLIGAIGLAVIGFLAVYLLGKYSKEDV